MQSLGFTLVLALAINYFKLNLLCLIPLQATQTEFSYKKIIELFKVTLFFVLEATMLEVGFEIVIGEPCRSS